MTDEPKRQRTNKQVAELLEIHPTLASRWRNGRRTPHPKHLHRIAHLIDGDAAEAIVEMAALYDHDAPARAWSAYLRYYVWLERDYNRPG